MNRLAVVKALQIRYDGYAAPGHHVVRMMGAGHMPGSIRAYTGLTAGQLCALINHIARDIRAGRITL
jgi:hypothetical protein